ncbi:biotin--[acetyl-CoA-carboxylase] ligase [Aquabacterium sp. A08]|uniref:biotin--[acetyl-CoA-carboxylase] ligase n=1 Tax=Aquabacterium sp. A08 TaxID=2718532 RepID=UPI0014212BE2|nr:biotin--[acetyl-CoA-carboxylase] ligase [Aquabacterium sp. A08]NIC40685.1 biotin--[acetyl-CoA-carboxylase] ligase [Aquabacterium sp. A08]
MNAPDPALATLTRAAEDLWQAVAPLLPGFSVEVLPRIDSTNTELMRRARAGRHEPVLLVALEQTAGRGRRGRGWVSTPGGSLTFSLGLPLRPRDWSGLSLVVGVSLAEQLPPAVRLKWPNDLWWHDRKLGGILVETANVGDLRYAVVGAGLNLHTPTLPDPAPDTAPSDAPPPMPPVGLDALVPPGAPLPDAGDALLTLVPALVRDLLRFEREGFAPFGPRFAARDALYGRPVRLSDGQEGTAVGVRSDGALLLDTGQRTEAVVQHEVSVRPC